MEPLTDTVNTRDWLEASKGVKIAAYIESYMPTLSIYEKPLSDQNFYDALKSISVLFPVTPIISLRLHQEFQAWDALSDEALMIFEQELD
jgi:hypothetical protein